MKRPVVPSAGSAHVSWRLTSIVRKLAALLFAVALAAGAAQLVKVRTKTLLGLPVPPPRIDVVYARWGGAGQFVNVTNELRQLCNNQTVCSTRRDLDAWLGDEPHGVERTLHIRFACGGASRDPIDVVESSGHDGSAVDLRCN